MPGTLVDYSDLMPIGDAVPAEEVVDRIAEAIEIYAVTVHNMGNCEVLVDGDTATAESVIVAHHVYADPAAPGRPAACSRACATATAWCAPGRLHVEHRRATTDWRAWWEPRTPTYVAGQHQ